MGFGSVRRGATSKTARSTMEIWRRILGLDLAVGIVAGLLMVTLPSSDHSHILAQLVRSLAVGVCVGTPIGWVFHRFGAAISSRRAPFNWALVVGTTLVCAFAGVLLYNTACLALGLLPRNDFWTAVWARMQFSAVLALVFGIGGFGYWMLRADLEATLLALKDKQLEHARASHLAVEAQLASLESHIRPHFLFNALNTISSLIPENPQLAETLVGRLAALLRLSLDSTHERVSSLETELKMVNDYLEIERARYGDRLRFQVQVPDELRGTAVPAFSLLTLVENSVKHAVAPRLGGAEIRVTVHARGGCLCVEVSDDGPGFTLASLRPGHGLDSLLRRLAAMFGPAGTLETKKSGEFTVVTLRLPLPDAQPA